MLDNMLQNADGIQAEMLAELKAIIVKEEMNGISIEANAAREIKNISINDDLLSKENKEQLEDFLVIGLNKVLNQIAEKEKEQSQKLLQKMMPGGFGNLFG